MCLLSECRGTEHGVRRTAQDFYPGMPSSAHCLLRESIAAKETKGEPMQTSGGKTRGLLYFGLCIRGYFKLKKMV